MLSRIIHVALACCLGLGTIFQALPAKAQSQPDQSTMDRAGGHDAHLQLVFQTDHAPGVGQVATLTVTATPEINAPNVMVEWLLPLGAELLNGAASEAIGAVAAGQSASQMRQIRFQRTGTFKVMARAGFDFGPNEKFSALGVLFFTLGEDGSTAVSDQDPNATAALGDKMETEVLPVVTTAAVRAPNDDPCFTVFGRITRWDYPNSTNPSYGAREEVPLRYVGVVMREEDTVFDDSYGGSTTDADGRYSFSFCDDDGFADEELELYVRVHAEIDFNGYDVVSVEDDGIIDDRWQFDSEPFDSEGGTHEVNLRMKDDGLQSSVMNIADAVFDAWSVWNNAGGAKGDDAIFDEEAEVHYEPGDGVENSFYNGYFLTGSNILNNNDISIADDSSDPDPWDDSVIIHEWGHFADDMYGCDDNGGGPHNIDQLTDDLELAWGEGYPDYFQSAVRSLTRRSNASWYLDVDGSGNNGIAVDLETYDNTRAVGAMRPDLLSEFNELAIAAMLWDLFDSNNDARNPGPPATGPFDSVQHGHRVIQEVYTDPFFESNGDWADDTCTSFVYLWSWLKLGKPTDAATAEAVRKNNGRTNPFFGGGRAAATEATQVSVAATDGPATILATTTNDNPNQIDPRWWNRLTMVADNSASMADSDKFGAVKIVMKETVNDLGDDPKGAEVKVATFNNGSPRIQTVMEGQFRADSIYAQIDPMATIGAADPGCPTPVNAMGSVQQAIQGETRGQVWLYTDTDTYLQPSLPLLKGQLNQQQMRASFALLGGCAPVARRNSDVSGNEEDYLQLAADGSQSSGIVPYLLTALGSGGQFLYVSPDQLANATDILRAQLANSAGAGKWSDYVSDSFTYRWDRLEPREVQWMPTGLLADQGQLSTTPKRITLPAEFSYFGDGTTAVDVNLDGYIYMNPCLAADPKLCITSYQDADILRKEPLNWEIIPVPPRSSVASADVEYGPQVHVWTGGLGINEWFIISTEGIGDYGPNDFERRAYQVWLNLQTGELRYLYDQIRPSDASGARIAVSDFTLGLTNEVVVSGQDLNGAVSGGGYKFTPAPPVPARTYTVKADALIERIGFLQTGYSGAFLPMVVTDPNGVAVVCGSGGVTCTNVDHIPGDLMVQYIEVPVNGVAGAWRATIDASSSQATFSFNALAASDLSADSPSTRLLPSTGTSPLIVQLGRTTEGNTLTGWFQSPNGLPFGTEFTLYDNGLSGDGRSGDGRFALPDLSAPGRGIGYLWVKGTTAGVAFERADPIPFNFEPLKVTALSTELSNDNEPVELTFQVDNLDSRDVCVDADVTLPDGWSADWNFDEISCQGIAAGASQSWVLTVTPNWPDAPSGAKGEVAVAFIESGEGAIQASDSVSFVRRRAPAVVAFDRRAENYEIVPSDTISVPVIIYAEDAQGYPVADGTLVEVTTSQGVISPISAQTAGVNDQATLELIDGRALFLFTPSTAEGDVTATVTLGALTDSITLHVQKASAQSIQLSATPTDLFGGATKSGLVAVVRDEQGKPVAGAMVRLFASDDDGTQGTINGGEAFTATTTATGEVKATFTKANGGMGSVWVTAELLSDEDGEIVAKQEDDVVLILDPPAEPNDRLLLPLIQP